MARKTYKVKKGDSYFKIAERLWGNRLFAGQLIKANPGINKLFPGIVLRLPKVDVNDPEPWFGQAAWGRAQEIEKDRLEQRRKEQQKAEIQQLRDTRLLQEMTLPDLQVNMPDWFRELPEGSFGPFTKEEAWEAANDILTLVEDLGLVPGPDFGKGPEFGQGEGPPEAPEVDEPPAPETTEASDEAGDKGELRPAQQGETPTETPTPTATETQVPTPFEYVVQKDDTLEKIAGQFEVTVEQLAEWNEIQDVNLIKTGQILSIGESAQVPTATPTATAAAKVEPTPTATQAAKATQEEKEEAQQGETSEPTPQRGIELPPNLTPDDALKYLDIWHSGRIADDKMMGGENYARLGYEYDILKRILTGERLEGTPFVNISLTAEQLFDLAYGNPVAPVQSPTLQPTETLEPIAIEYEPDNGNIKTIMPPWDPSHSDSTKPNPGTFTYLISELSKDPDFYLAPLAQIIKANELEGPEDIEANDIVVFPQSPPTAPERVQYGENVIPINVPPYLKPVFEFLENPDILPPIFQPGDTLGFGDNQVVVIPRDEWIGETNISFDLNALYEGINTLEPDSRFEMYEGDLEEEINTITVHHTGGDEADEYQSNITLEDWEAMTDEERNEEIRKIQRYHQQQNGWADIGYHFIIAPDGTVYEGRDLRVRGAHTGGFNSGNVGVLVMGNFTDVPEDGDEGYDKFAEQVEAQMGSLEAVAASVGRSFGVNCLGYHRHYNGSACPGELTDEIDQVKQNLGIQGSYECYRPPND